MQRRQFLQGAAFLAATQARPILGANDRVNIGIVGKYFDTGDFMLSDAYISVIEAIKFSCYKLGVRPNISWVNSKEFEGKKKTSSLNEYDGIIVPGGFGETGIEGKLKVIEHARKNKIPYFGLCYGMQLAVVEYARNVLKIRDAQTAEINAASKNLIVDIMPEQKELLEKDQYGATMRLGRYPARLKEGTIAHKEYGTNRINERHRHRYEINPKYIERLEKGGLIFSGTSPNKKLMEIAELSKSEHPFFLGTQFHPEFKAHPLSPHPLFTAFINASIQGK